MNYSIYFNILVIAFLILIQTVSAEEIIEQRRLFDSQKYPSKNEQDVLNGSRNEQEVLDGSKNEKFYMIFLNTTTTTTTSLRKRQNLVDSVVSEIHNLIIENKATYQNPAKLDEMEQESRRRRLRKRGDNSIEMLLSDESDSSFVYPISSTSHKTVLYAYLTPELVKEIEKAPNVIACESPKTLKLAAAKYSSRDIQLETGWSKVKVQSKADMHLSLISQGIFNNDIVHQYDTNYYYPSTAGKGVDIFIMDSGFDFNYQEFSNNRNRIVRCGYNITEGRVLSMRSTSRCYSGSPIVHGTEVADIAAGSVHGVANKANVYGFVFNDRNVFYMSDLLGAVDYVKKHLFKAHRAIFNFSFGDYFPIHQQDQSMIYFQELVNELSEAGAVFISAGGNESRPTFEEEKNVGFYPCAFDNVICVGAIDNVGWNDNPDITIDELNTNVMKSENYNRALFSNYGPKIDLYAPGIVSVVFRDGTNQLVGGYDTGTSFSAPIVSGVAACIISEHPEVKFTSALMRDYLYRYGEKDRIGNLGEDDNNVFVNNGKRLVYSSDNKYNGCGIRAGKQMCANACCSQDGYCTTDAGQCRTDRGCQVNYGYYVTVYSPELGRCGYGYGACPLGSCCSAEGYCGSTSDYCDVGCQEDYGFCKKKYIMQ